MCRGTHTSTQPYTCTRKLCKQIYLHVFLLLVNMMITQQSGFMLLSNLVKFIGCYCKALYLNIIGNIAAKHCCNIVNKP